MSNAYKKWTIEEEILLLKHIKDGLDIKNIAIEHKRSIGAIRSRISKIVFNKSLISIIIVA